MLKCPIHELPRNVIIKNLYARLSGHHKNYLDACLEGSFTSKEVEAKSSFGIQEFISFVAF
jgi:hypothetical protein